MSGSAVFKKLNLKGQREIYVLNAPESFEKQIQSLGNLAVRRSLTGADSVAFSLAFVTTLEEVNSLAGSLARLAVADAVIWFAYPKKTSRRYHCDFNRDTGWARLGELGYEGVRLVAIDEDWSAMRFRRAEFIRSFKRDAANAISEQGRKRAAERK